MEENAVMKKKKKMDRIFLIIALIFLIVAIIMVYQIGKISEKPLPEPVDLHNVIYGYTEQEDVYAKIEVQYLTDAFASYGDGSLNDELYYYTTDSDGYGYIVNLTNETFAKLRIINEYTYSENWEMEIPEPITITGITKPISEDMKNMAIEMYSEIYGTNEVTEENFDEYYGTIYLKEGEIPDEAGIYSGILVFSMIFFILFMTMYSFLKIRTNIKLKKVKKSGEYEKLEQELALDEKDEFLKVGTVLTKSYILDGSFGLEVIKYEDIAWVYVHKIKNSAITIQRSLIVMTKDKKKHSIAVTDSLKKKTQEEFDTIFKKIVEKAPNALVGYTKENIDIMKGKRLV